MGDNNDNDHWTSGFPEGGLDVWRATGALGVPRDQRLFVPNWRSLAFKIEVPQTTGATTTVAGTRPGHVIKSLSFSVTGDNKANLPAWSILDMFQFVRFSRLNATFEPGVGMAKTAMSVYLCWSPGDFTAPTDEHEMYQWQMVHGHISPAFGSDGPMSVSLAMDTITGIVKGGSPAGGTPILTCKVEFRATGSATLTDGEVLGVVKVTGCAHAGRINVGSGLFAQT